MLELWKPCCRGKLNVEEHPLPFGLERECPACWTKLRLEWDYTDDYGSMVFWWEIVRITLEETG